LCRIAGIPISNQVIGDLLFPDDVDVTVSERVRKVTRMKAQKVFCSEMVNFLNAQGDL
jgi:hypothetical protein